MSPSPHVYLDMKYDSTTVLGQNWAGYIDVDTAYVWDPGDQASGAGRRVTSSASTAPLWTETVTTMDEAEYLLFPASRGRRRGGMDAGGRSGVGRVQAASRSSRRAHDGAGDKLLSLPTDSLDRTAHSPGARPTRSRGEDPGHSRHAHVDRGRCRRGWVIRHSAASAAFIDHTLLRPEATPDEIDHAAQQGRELGTASVCINGRWVARVREALEGSAVKTCAVIGFPLGAMATSVKADEARQAVADGATELDMVMSLGEAKAGHWDLVAKDIAAVIAAAGKVPVKVILETALLAPAEIVQASLVAMDTWRGVREDIVRISWRRRGDGAGGAADAPHRGTTIGVKASGGVRSSEMAIRFLAAGANRLGTSMTREMTAIIGPERRRCRSCLRSCRILRRHRRGTEQREE